MCTERNKIAPRECGWKHGDSGHSAGEKACLRKRTKNRLDSGRPSHGRRLPSLNLAGSLYSVGSVSWDRRWIAFAFRAAFFHHLLKGGIYIYNPKKQRAFFGNAKRWKTWKERRMVSAASDRSELVSSEPA